MSTHPVGNCENHSTGQGVIAFLCMVNDQITVFIIFAVKTEVRFCAHLDIFKKFHFLLLFKVHYAQSWLFFQPEDFEPPFLVRTLILKKIMLPEG